MDNQGCHPSSLAALHPYSRHCYWIHRMPAQQCPIMHAARFYQSTGKPLVAQNQHSSTHNYLLPLNNYVLVIIHNLSSFAPL